MHTNTNNEPEEHYEAHELTPADSGYWVHDEEAGTVTINPTSIDHRTVDAEKFFTARGGGQ